MKRIAFFILLTGLFLGCKKSQRLNNIDKIVLVDGENLDRCEIGQLIKAISSSSPKVIGINILFVGGIDKCDSILQKEIRTSDKVTLVEGFESGERVVSDGAFANAAMMNGLPGFIQSKDGVTDHYYRVTNHLGGWEYSFPFQLALQYDTANASQLAAKSTPNDYPITFYNSIDDFKILKASDIISKGEMLKNKIVIIGYLGKSDENYFKTPVTEKSTSKTLGTVILANIVLDVLQDLETPDVQVSKFSEFIRKQQLARKKSR